MKKFLLTLIVTMLTCIGAWAQGSITPASVDLYVGDEAYVEPNWSQGASHASYTFLYNEESSSSVATATKWNDYPYQNYVHVDATGVGHVTISVKNDVTNETLSFDVTVKPLSEETNVTISVENIGGKEYYVVNVPQSGAFGAKSDRPSVILKNGATLEGLKEAANVKVTGVLANSDVYELIYLIGDNKNTSFACRVHACCCFPNI